MKMSDFPFFFAQARWKFLSFFSLDFDILTPFLSFFHTKHVTRAKQLKACVYSQISTNKNKKRQHLGAAVRSENQK